VFSASIPCEGFWEVTSFFGMKVVQDKMFGFGKVLERFGKQEAKSRATEDDEVLDQSAVGSLLYFSMHGYKARYCFCSWKCC
jgi:hypothetical protein